MEQNITLAENFLRTKRQSKSFTPNPEVNPVNVHKLFQHTLQVVCFMFYVLIILIILSEVFYYMPKEVFLLDVFWINSTGFEKIMWDEHCYCQK